MIRFALRAVGFVLLAAAFVAVIYDGTRTLANNQLTWTPLEQTWANVHVTSLEAVQTRLRATLPGWLAELVLSGLRLPAALVFGVLGVLLMLAGRKPKPLIGYAR